MPNLLYWLYMLPERRGEPPPEAMRKKQSKASEFDWERGEIPQSDVRYTASRSSGPGGQGVNTTDSRIELRWTIGDSQHLSMKQKELLRQYAGTLARKTILAESDELKFVCASERSQYQNKQDCLRKLNTFLRKALTPEEERIATKKSKGVKGKERRMKEVDKRRKSGRSRVTNWE